MSEEQIEYMIWNAVERKQCFSLTELQERTGLKYTELFPWVERLVLNGKVTLSVSVNAEANNVYKSHYEYLCTCFMDLVTAHLFENRSIGFYASKMCISPKYLSFVVKQTCGKTPTVLIREKVIEEIKFRLCCTQESIKEVAYKLNFPNPSFFGKYFKAETGVSPSAYRAIHLKQKTNNQV